MFVYAPPKCVAEIGNRIMAMDGCMNIYASTADKNYRAGMNIYGSHYLKTKLIGSSGGLRSDLVEALDLITTGKINPAVGITHIGGINAIVDTTLYLKKIPGSKKITYPQINLPDTGKSFVAFRSATFHFGSCVILCFRQMSTSPAPSSRLPRKACAYSAVPP